MFLAFMLPASVVDNRENLPRFAVRFWYRRDRLDARPVIWSLRNRPQAKGRPLRRDAVLAVLAAFGR
jgi:hypothetical protein